MRATVTTTSSAVVENTEPGALDSKDDWSSQSVLVKNMTGTASIFVEISDDATEAEGFEWEATDPPLEVTLEPGESLNMIVAATEQDLHLLKGGR